MKLFYTSYFLAGLAVMIISGCAAPLGDSMQKNKPTMSAESFEKATGFIYPGETKDPFLTGLMCNSDLFESANVESENNQVGILCRSAVTNSLQSYIGWRRLSIGKFNAAQSFSKSYLISQKLDPQKASLKCDEDLSFKGKYHADGGAALCTISGPFTSVNFMTGDFHRGGIRNAETFLIVVDGNNTPTTVVSKMHELLPKIKFR